MQFTTATNVGPIPGHRPAPNMWQSAFTIFSNSALVLGGLTLLVVLLWQGVSAAGNPDPLAVPLDSAAAVLDISVLVFREGLECILVLAALTAGMAANGTKLRQPVGVGAGAGFICTLITWRIAISLMDDLTTRMSALTLQAATGLIALIVLLIVMNWFFHRMYWTGWISMHTRKRQGLVSQSNCGGASKAHVWWGLAALGFTSLYREGFEVVLFLQSYRLKSGQQSVLRGVLMGLFFSGILAVLTFVVQRRLPYRRMLVVTGLMLGVVLLVRVGEQTQEMQLAQWLPRTELPALHRVLPIWAGVWFSIFPTLETISAQALAAVLVVGSYFAARSGSREPGAPLPGGERLPAAHSRPTEASALRRQ